ncbi:MAG: LexA repressor [Alphaproteobacteria bacterium MarineAlpha9_Bin4]|nr:repressor LexA [Pelagibacterales bacterium]PPR27559.1 MAG: LexA repressor [Alphaproteobacteria bacterium MarineAlpha9_Bin4]|tara:strand:- start:2766 stop:3422 length:657 start_codon:yes stop_codon:yes gene_type:complete
MLTSKQLKLLDYLKKSFKDNKVSPSFEEMKIALGLKSKSGIHRLITALEERGFIKRLHNKARAIKVLPTNDERTFKKPPVALRNFNSEDKLEKVVKVYGKIAAGTPVEAIENPEGFLSIPGEMIKNTNQHYALKVSGESMIDAGILDGDIAVLEKTENVKNGDIVVALIDSQEATLKRIRKKSNSIALEPANKNFETRIFGPKRITIQGKLVGIIRNY